MADDAPMRMPLAVHEWRHLELLVHDGKRAEEVTEITIRSPVAAVPLDISPFTRVRVLSLHNGRLHRLPAEIGALTQLRTLLVGRNQLTTLPDALCACKHLRLLSAADNHITHLPEGIGRLRRLETLQLRNNRLSTLPHSMARLHRLELLDLSHNLLEDVPQCVADGMVALESLGVSGNRLRRVPIVPSVRVLQAEKNAITHVSGAIARCTRMTDLMLSDNPLRAIDGALCACVGLQSLSASRCKLRFLPDVGGMPQLKRVRVNNNRLCTLPPLPPSLSELDASHNELVEMPPLAHCDALRLALCGYNRLHSAAQCVERLPPPATDVFVRVGEVLFDSGGGGALCVVSLVGCPFPAAEVLVLETMVVRDATAYFARLRASSARASAALLLVQTGWRCR